LSDPVFVVRRGHVRVSKAKGSSQTGNRNEAMIAALREEIAGLREELRRLRHDIAGMKRRIEENFTNRPSRTD
jgi:molecular chaperone GrpE (heat shock protein)